MSPSAHLYVTLDDNDEQHVLELVRVEGENYYIRDNGTWVQIDPDADNERVWDRVIENVTPDAIPAFDESAKKNGDAVLSDLQDFVIADEGDAA